MHEKPIKEQRRNIGMRVYSARDIIAPCPYCDIAMTPTHTNPVTGIIDMGECGKCGYKGFPGCCRCMSDKNCYCGSNGKVAPTTCECSPNYTPCAKE